MKISTNGRPFAALCALGFFIGCGGSGGGGLPPTNAGSGSTTLLIHATVNANDLNGNGSNSPENFTTDLFVRISKNGQPVTGATVKMSTSLGSLDLFDNRDGTYTYTYAGYSPFHTLSVISGTDTVSGATLAGPDVHKITFPIKNQTWGLNQTMTATWQRSAIAQEVVISTRDCKSTDQGMPQATDSGSYVLPGDRCFNVPRPEQRVTITRTNSINLGGGTAGSDFFASIENKIDPIAIP